jgi:Holliday junction DNA helicase RuvA
MIHFLPWPPMTIGGCGCWIGGGRKTAERLLVEMRDRVAGFGPWEPAVSSGNGTGVPATMPADPHTEASSALIALGYKPAEVTKLLKQVEPTAQTTEELIRRALQLAVVR